MVLRRVCGDSRHGNGVLHSPPRGMGPRHEAEFPHVAGCRSPSLACRLALIGSTRVTYSNRAGASGRPERHGREVGAEPIAVRRGDLPAHDLGVGPDEEVRQRHVRSRQAGLGTPSSAVTSVRLRADVSGSRGDVQDLHAPTADPVGNRLRLNVTNTDLGWTRPPARTSLGSRSDSGASADVEGNGSWAYLL